MTSGKAIGVIIVAGGGWFVLTRTGALAGTGLALDELGLIRHEASPAERTQALALRQPNPGNAPIVPSASFAGAGGVGAIAGLGAAALPLLGLTGAGLAFATAGIGLAVVFISYKLLKMRASMHTNDVRDQWQKQFVGLYAALGLPPMRAEDTRGSGPGNIEMASIIAHFDPSQVPPNQPLWTAVTKTQDETRFHAAASNVDAFLHAHGVPVQDV